MDLNAMSVFVEVVRAGSFTAAARALDMPKSSVSRKVADLEDHLRTQLLHRTTRSVGLTDVGEIYYRKCAAVVAEAKAAEDLVAEMHSVPCGRLRMTAPPTFAFLGPILAEYLVRYPQVRIELTCTERLVDLVAEGFDLAVRAGPLADSSLVTRRLGTVSRFLVAAPDYLDRHGTPRTPDELQRHDAVVFGGGREHGVWPLRAKGRRLDVRPAPRLVVDDYDTLFETTRSGLGIALLPDYVCQDAIESGVLLRVLRAWTSPEIPIHAVHFDRKHPPTKLTALLDLLAKRLSARRSAAGG